MEIEDFKDKHIGEEAYIIGNGPSLNQINLDKLQDKVTFGCNCIFVHKSFYPKYYSLEDWICVRNNFKQINEYNKPEYKFIPKGLPSNYIKGDNVINIDFGRYKRGACLVNKIVNKDISKFYWSCTVTNLLIQLAYYMGCNPIYLLGVDHFKSSTNNPVDHFSKYYPVDQVAYTDVDLLEYGYKQVKKLLEEKGYKIYNLTPDTKLDVFEKMDINEVI